MKNKSAALYVQCTEKSSGVVGDFLGSMSPEEKYQAISPVFGGLVELFTWCRDNGWVAQPFNPDFPVGVYTRSDQV